MSDYVFSVRAESVGANTLASVEQRLAKIPGGLEKALRAATKRAASNIRTKSADYIRERYAITRKNIRTEQNVKVRYTYLNGVQAYVTFKGHKIPLYRYQGSSPKTPKVQQNKTVFAMVGGSPKMVHPGVAAKGHQLVGTKATKFDRAFVAQMKSGHIGIFERTGGKTADGGDAIHELMGSSVPQMLGNKEVQEKIVSGAYEKMNERLEHEADRILAGLV